MLSKILKEKSKGDPNCESCKGTGMVMFMDSMIFCSRCHDEEKIAALWKSIDMYIASRTKGIGKNR